MSKTHTPFTNEQVRHLCGLLSDEAVKETLDLRKKEMPWASQDRGTGRTTKMIVEALTDHVQYGRRVFFIFPTKHHSHQMLALARFYARACRFDVDLLSALPPSEFRERLQALKGTPQPVVVFDHTVPEEYRQAVAAALPPL